jgi:hypothetical protein
MRPALLLAALAACLATPAPARAYEISKQLEVYGYAQGWLTLYEQMADARGLFQHPSGDEATDSVSGFRIATARVGLRLQTADGRFGVVTQLRFEENPGILDLYARATPARWLSFQVGQFKVPSVFENLQENCDLDFITRTRIADALADYSLSRTTYASSLFYGNKSAQRDLGVGLKGEVRPGGVPLRWFAMVGNGLGATLFIGGNTAREYVITNHFGHYFYSGRVEVEPWPKVITLGGHGSYNRHDNIVFNSGRAVLDLDRFSYSADARVAIPGTGLRLAGAYGAGEIRDDTLGTGKTDFAYSGWEARLVPLLRRATPHRFWRENLFEVAFRYDEVRTEADETGVHVRRRTFTPGLGYRFGTWVKVQLNYILRRDHDPLQPVPANDSLILSLQVKI